MKIQIVPVIIVCAYIVGMLLIGYLTNKFKIKTSTDYLLGGRRLGLFFVAPALPQTMLAAEAPPVLPQKRLAARDFQQAGMCLQQRLQ